MCTKETETFSVYVCVSTCVWVGQAGNISKLYDEIYPFTV